MSLLVSAGEASGDRLAASALASLGGGGFGMGGEGVRGAGAEVLVDARDVAANGVVDVLSRAPALLRAWRTLSEALVARRPTAALIVDFPDFHRHLARRARSLGARVVWCVAPQVWAWRPSRVRAFAPWMSRLAVLFEHELGVWRRAGVDAVWVGHPAAERAIPPRASRPRPVVALLPGSRRGVVRAHLGLHREVATLLARRGVDCVFLCSPSLPDDVAREIARAARDVGAQTRRCPPEGASPLLSLCDAALTTAGTASLEVALSGAPFVVAHRVGAVEAAIARRSLITRWVGLPNVLLDREVGRELLQEAASPGAVADALCRALERRDGGAVADELRARVTPADGACFGARVASLVEACL
ncbi:MAG: hypothetical protein IT374_12430 [Polyangiaceae bacterium]|nr:hypothetical protein [Polyangiaceae bacterium]